MTFLKFRFFGNFMKKYWETNYSFIKWFITVCFFNYQIQIQRFWDNRVNLIEYPRYRRNVHLQEINQYIYLGYNSYSVTIPF